MFSEYGFNEMIKELDELSKFKKEMMIFLLP